MNLELLQQSLVYLIASTVGAFLWAPILTKLLYKYNITRRADFDFTLRGDRQHKVGTPIMGGLLVVITVTVVTMLFNWERRYTYVPIGAMGIAAVLGAADDLLNIFGAKRRLRHLDQTITLIKVHRKWYMKILHALTLPWAAFRHLASTLGSHPGKGMQVHEKLLLQFLAGAVTAWWVYTKLGPSWHTLWIPFDGYVDVGWWIIPIIIFFVMFTANAVNVADGLDGLAGGSLLSAFTWLMVLSWVE